MITDQISDILFTPSKDGNTNLLREGIAEEKIYFVGNVMIDTLVRLLPKVTTETKAIGQANDESYALITLHRPSNVDNQGILSKIMSTLLNISKLVPIIFPIHPRTRRRIDDCGISIPKDERFRLIDPVGYLEFLSLQKDATLVITDSGGIQEETTYLGVPCLTIRENTERPITVNLGGNTLIGQDMGLLEAEVRKILNGNSKKGSIPPLWDGMAGERIAEVIFSKFL